MAMGKEDKIRTEQMIDEMPIGKEDDDCVVPMEDLLKPIKMMPRKERMKLLKKARKDGLPTKFPLFYPPGYDPSLAPPIPPMSDHQLEMLFDHILSQDGHEEFDIYTGPAQKPDQLSLPELDEMAREVLFSVEIPKRKKKRAVSIGKQKKKVASSSKKPMTSA